MAKADYLNPDEMGFATQLKLFKNNIGKFAALLEITPAQIEQQAADADFFEYVVLCYEMLNASGKSATAFRNHLRHAKDPGPATPMPVPILPLAPPAVPPGVEQRFRRLVRQIKRHPNYTPAIGAQLGIEGVASTKRDPSTLQPDFTLERQANGVMVRWSWDKHHEQVDMCELVVDRNDGQGERYLICDSTPGYLDAEPFPATPVKWTYRAIYHKGEFRIGQWSAPVTVIVCA